MIGTDASPPLPEGEIDGAPPAQGSLPPPPPPVPRPPIHQFNLTARLLHWLMAALLLSMLFIGVGMVSSVARYHELVAIHRPLGIAILLLAAVRYLNRRSRSLPPFIETMPPIERRVASYSERFLYFLMFALPLVGWAMLSAARYPVHMFGGFNLPPILPRNPALYAVLRRAHTILAYALFLTVLSHLAGVLLHALVLRDGILYRMAPWKPHSKASQMPRT